MPFSLAFRLHIMYSGYSPSKVRQFGNFSCFMITGHPNFPISFCILILILHEIHFCISLAIVGNSWYCASVNNGVYCHHVCSEKNIFIFLGHIIMHYKNRKIIINNCKYGRMLFYKSRYTR